MAIDLTWGYPGEGMKWRTLFMHKSRRGTRGPLGHERFPEGKGAGNMRGEGENKEMIGSLFLGNSFPDVRRRSNNVKGGEIE